jgi:UDP-N-acetylglucosamine--N-acetylmuramyl-(pentapeptide) pyrophosphoryl-undecaprenol N-acetylglucosamine transferase
MDKKSYIFAGGGTGGHLFPALAIADELHDLAPDSEIIFVGTKNKIEARVVPQSGYSFRTIWISGFSRKINLKNLLFPFKVVTSLFQSMMIIKKFKPAVIIGTGGYVSGPVLKMASMLKIPYILQDHNSYPGVTTKLLAANANEVHLAFEEAKKYLKRNDNIFISGFPVRKEIKRIPVSESRKFFGLDESKLTLFITGGSQGSRSMNSVLRRIAPKLVEKNIQILWQVGALEYLEIKEELKEFRENIKIYEFIKEMNFAYSACDFAVTRSGATTIGEIVRLNVPAILIPFPFAAEDHQTKNAESLVKQQSAIIMGDHEMNEK